MERGVLSFLVFVADKNISILSLCQTLDALNKVEDYNLQNGVQNFLTTSNKEDWAAWIEQVFTSIKSNNLLNTTRVQMKGESKDSWRIVWILMMAE
jgi:hypothetical protein